MSEAPRGPEIITFGCRLNAFESEVIRGHAACAGLAGAVIVNTCAVTGEAARQARQAIRRAHRDRPDAPIIVTGCAAQLEPDAFAALPGVARVLGNADKLDPASYTAGAAPRRVSDIMAVRETAGHLITGFAGRSRAFVQIQNGCDHRCTFCIIPFARGPSRSVAPGAVVEQVRGLVEQGFAEIVLTGVDIGAYGQEIAGRPALGGLVGEVLRRVPELARLRLSSIDPIEVDEELVALFAHEPRLMPHLHLSLQAGDDVILKRMKRRHLRADAIALCARLRRVRPDMVFGADLIAGFPTETEAMFARTLGVVEACGLTYLHVFPYSVRTGTAAARMPQLPVGVRKERGGRLREAGAAALAGFLATRVGRSAEVLIEKDRLGRTEHFAPLVLDAEGPAPAPGTVVTAMATGVAEGALVGRIAA